MGEHREEQTLRAWFDWLGAERAAKIRYVCSDIWKPYLNVIREKIPRAIHILDRFHIVQKMNKAIDEVRAEEARTLKKAGREPVLTHTRWRLLKRLRHHAIGPRAYLPRILLQALAGSAVEVVQGPRHRASVRGRAAGSPHRRQAGRT